MSSDCPSIEILAAYLDHGLTPEEQDMLERHLVTCRSCRELLKAALQPKQEA